MLDAAMLSFVSIRTGGERSRREKKIHTRLLKTKKNLPNFSLVSQELLRIGKSVDESFHGWIARADQKNSNRFFERKNKKEEKNSNDKITVKLIFTRVSRILKAFVLNIYSTRVYILHIFSFWFYFVLRSSFPVNCCNMFLLYIRSFLESVGLYFELQQLHRFNLIVYIIKILTNERINVQNC